MQGVHRSIVSVHIRGKIVLYNDAASEVGCEGTIGYVRCVIRMC